MVEKIFSPKNWERLISKERKKILPIQPFIKISNPKKTEVWADVGCGPGYFTIPLAKKVKTIFAIDISDKMLNICRSRALKSKTRNIEYVLIKDYKLPFNKKFFDRILLVNVYHEMKNKKKTIGEFKRTLKPDGFLYLIDWKYENMDIGPPLKHRVPMNVVIKDFSKHGFSIIDKIDVYNFNYMLVLKKDGNTL